ncbi:hypothetical protein DY000_02022717 [Brassica cretica]|uniref:Uncharacterized protein n=1 Tax=Brassica cretica TaxID=69181 RepID=A0ABQ7E796_BRACR|nr:hypothetical protein DY000_02022717 [Brassica cretica]
MLESGNFVAANSESIISSSSTEHGEIAKLRNQISKQAHQNSNVQISNDLVEQLNDKSEECEALKKAMLVLTERISVLRNVLVASSVGFFVVLGGIISLNFKV